MTTKTWLWALMLLGGMFIAYGLGTDGPLLSRTFETGAVGFALGASFVMFVDAASSTFGGRRAAWKSKNGLPCRHGDDPMKCPSCTEGGCTCGTPTFCTMHNKPFSPEAHKGGAT